MRPTVPGSRLVLVLLGLSALAAAPPLAAQSAYVFATPVLLPLPHTYSNGKFSTGYADDLALLTDVEPRRLLLRESFGYSLWNLSNPASPILDSINDLESKPGYERTGDGFQTVLRVAAPPDGSRILVNWKQDNHGTLLMRPVTSGSGTSFDFAGEFNPGRAGGGIAIVKTGARYLGLSLPQTGVVVAEVTSFVNGQAANRPGSIPGEMLAGAPSGFGAVAAGAFVVYTTGAGELILVDARGASGGAAGVTFRAITPESLGFAPRVGLYNASALFDAPAGRLWVFAAGFDPARQAYGMGLASSTDGWTFTPQGPAFFPASPYTGSSSAAALVKAGAGVRALSWVLSAEGRSKLFTLPSEAWGADLSPSAAVDPSQFTDPRNGSSLFSSATITRAFSDATGISAYVGTTQATFAIRLSGPAEPPGTCTADGTHLCLNQGRFQVSVAWRNYNDGSAGAGMAAPLTSDSGTFWFFNSANIELVVKVLDGRAVNNRFWVLYGALSDVEYTLTVRDTATGSVKTYVNPARTLASVADVNALRPAGESASADAPPTGNELAALAARHAARTGPSAERLPEPSGRREPLSACSSTVESLCLNQNRFEVNVSWRNYNDGSTGTGKAVPLTSESGYFWFFESANVELVVKVLDGRAVNGKFWVLYGALTDVEYTMTVTDTVTGAMKAYVNPPRHLASVADITAL